MVTEDYCVVWRDVFFVVEGSTVSQLKSPQQWQWTEEGDWNCVLVVRVTLCVPDKEYAVPCHNTEHFSLLGRIIQSLVLNLTSTEIVKSWHPGFAAVSENIWTAAVYWYPCPFLAGVPHFSCHESRLWQAVNRRKKITCSWKFNNLQHNLIWSYHGTGGCSRQSEQNFGLEPRLVRMGFVADRVANDFHSSAKGVRKWFGQRLLFRQK